MEDKYVNMNINDVIIDKPLSFVVEIKDEPERHLCLYPVTIGKKVLLDRAVENLGINQENLKINHYLEMLRVVEEKKHDVCRIIAYHTMKGKEEIFDSAAIEERENLLSTNLDNEELATLLLYTLTTNSLEYYSQHLGIAEESERMNKVLRAKKKISPDNGDQVFGGKSIYGRLIDVACERYGWTYDYVVWGISYVNLQLLLADRVQEIFLSEEEKKKIPKNLLTSDKDTIKANKANMSKILSMDWH